MMFIQTEPTPNPAALKFIPGREVLASGTMEFTKPDEALPSPLAAVLFTVDGVVAVFLGPDFITITKDDHHEWDHLKPVLLGAIMEHFTAGLPVLADGETGSSTEGNHHSNTDGYDAASQEIVEKVIDILDTRVRPAVAQDGGDIIFHSFDAASGTVYLHMRGACAGCPASTMTLKQGVQNMMCHYIPEVTNVEAVL